MGISKTANRLTPHAYYVLKRVADFKSEYSDGEVFSMPVGVTHHSLVKTQLAAEPRIKPKANGGGYRSYDSDQHIKASSTSLRTCPDVSVFCGRLTNDEDNQKGTTANPAALYELLSDSTEAQDRGTKAKHYRMITSFQAYALLL